MEDAKKLSGHRNGMGFLSGVFVLAVSTILVKVLGFFYRVPMLSLLGTEGMGYFNTAFEVYAFLCIVATAGFPVALSVKISAYVASGQTDRTERVFRTGFRLLLVVGGAGTLLLLGGAGILASFLKNENAYPALLAMAPATLCTCLSGAWRGYFQGFGNMIPTAISSLIEAGGKLVFGVGFAWAANALGFDLALVTAFAVLGFGVGAALAFLYLISEKKKFHKTLVSIPTVVPSEGELRGLLSLALPVTLSSSVMGLGRTVDMAMILRRLQTIGCDPAETNRLYGAYTTLALPIFHLVPSLITSVALPLLPSIAAARASGHREEERDLLGTALRITAIFGIPACFALAAFARPVLELLFRGQESAIAVSAPLLSLLGCSVFFSCLMTVLGSALQAYGKPMAPICAMIAGIGVKTVAAYVLIGNQAVGIRGAPISTLFCGLTVTAAEFHALFRAAPDGIRLRDLFARPLFAAALAVGIPLGVTGWFPAAFHTQFGEVALLCGTAVLYLSFLVMLGVVTPAQLIDILRKRVRRYAK